MKQKLTGALLFLIGGAFSQTTLEAMRNIEISSQVIYVPNVDNASLLDTKYYVSGKFEMINKTAIDHITCDVIETGADNKDVLVASSTIVNGPDNSNALDPFKAGFFIEGNKVYFSIIPLTYTTKRRLVLTATGTVNGQNNSIIETICQPIPKIVTVSVPSGN